MAGFRIIKFEYSTFALGVGANEEQLFILIVQGKVGNRPGHIEPRAVKRRPKPFSLLMKQSEEARAEIRQKGHP